jgi:hypothetical protein
MGKSARAFINRSAYHVASRIPRSQHALLRVGKGIVSASRCFGKEDRLRFAAIALG